MTHEYKTAIGYIVVERREHDYIAMIADRKTQWGVGRSIYEAVGDLVITHFSEGMA